MDLFIIGVATGIAVSQLVEFIRHQMLQRRLDRAAAIMADVEAKPAEPTPDPREW